MEPCVIFANLDQSVVLVDIPRSIESAQFMLGQTPNRQLISCQAVAEPWQICQPTTGQGPNMSQSAASTIDELMIRATVEAALQELEHTHRGPWLLPRLLQHQTDDVVDGTATSQKRKMLAKDSEGQHDDRHPFIPPKAHYLLGSIESQRDLFLETAPRFHLIILDPPWPSRSVKRKRNGYRTAYNIEEIRNLLSLIPVGRHLELNGLVAVWVTNKPSIIDMLKAPGGIFDEWGLEALTEWIWVKITRNGRPVVDLDSTWRKPWERLIIARKKGSTIKLSPERKVMFAVPDLHSRKPNLKTAFDETLPKDYRGLEVFSRNLTVGWWSWGDQTLMFQQRHHWHENTATGQA